MRKRVKVAITIVALLAIGSILCTMGGCAAGLLNYWDTYTYMPKSTEATVHDDMWIHRQILGKYSHLCVPLLFGYQAYKQPFRAGVMVVDYDNKNKCTRLDITHLTLESDGMKEEFVSTNAPVSFPFKQYVEGVSHVKADALVDLGTWLRHGAQSKVRMTLTFVIYREDKEPLEQQMEEEFTPHHNEGLFFFHEFFMV